MAKILVTGASGLLGFEICRQLVAENHEIWAVDNLSRGHATPPCTQFITADLTDLPVLPLDFDYIYHYSAINGTKNFYERPNYLLWNNTVSDFAVFALAQRQTKLKKFVYASTSEIVSGDPDSPVSEKTDVVIKNIHNPRWSYRLAKISAENYLANSALPWLCLRYFNIYGSHSKPGHFVADQIYKIQQGKFELMGADETRSFCHVEDAVQATLHCAETAANTVINIGNDKETMILDAANIIATALGCDHPQWQITPGLPGSTATRRPNIQRLRELMPHYQPREFAAGIAEVIKNGDWK